MRERALGALCAVVVGGVVATTAAAAPAQEPAAADQVRPVAWHPCDGTPAQERTAECGTLEVPVDPSKPDGARTQLRLTRAKARQPDQRIGVLISPPGQDPAVLSANLRSRFDVVTYTRRTLGTTTECQPPSDVTFLPRTEQEFQHLFTANRAAFERCAKRHGPAWYRLDSATEAHDVDAIRATLGEQKISLLSTNPSALIGQAYAELFPARLRAVVLDGGADHSITKPEDYFAGAARAAEATFTAFLDWCAHNTTCAFKDMDLRQFFDTLRTTVENGGFKDLRGFPFDVVRFGKSTEAALAKPYLGWIGLAERFWDVYQRMHIGDPKEQDQGTRPQGAGSAGYAPPDPAAGAPDDGATASLCEDWAFDIKSLSQLRDIQRAMAAAAPLTKINAGQWDAAIACVGWPFAASNPPHPLKVDGGVPVLVTSTSQNVTQPVAWAESIAQQIPAAKRLVFAGAGTSAYEFSPCARDAIDTFLITLTAGAETTCPANPS